MGNERRCQKKSSEVSVKVQRKGHATPTPGRYPKIGESGRCAVLPCGRAGGSEGLSDVVKRMWVRCANAGNGGNKERARRGLLALTPL